MKTISELRAAFIAGTYTPTQAVTNALATIKEKDGDIHAFLHVYDDALELALAADAAYAKGEISAPLLGVPIAVKNNILVKGKPATGASKILEHYTATYDATIVTRLKEAGAILLVTPIWTNLRWVVQQKIQPLVQPKIPSTSLGYLAVHRVVLRQQWPWERCR